MKRPRVLLADDHQLLREAFARLLESGCDVVGTVADGRALLEAVPQLRPDIVVVDIAMPLLNGLDAARQLKRIMPEVKVIMRSSCRAASRPLSKGMAMSTTKIGRAHA